jgi:hypothetical protein
VLRCARIADCAPPTVPAVIRTVQAALVRGPQLSGFLAGAAIGDVSPVCACRSASFDQACRFTHNAQRRISAFLAKILSGCGPVPSEDFEADVGFRDAGTHETAEARLDEAGSNDVESSLVHPKRVSVMRQLRVQRKPLNQKMFNQYCADEISPMAKRWTTIAGHGMYSQTARHSPGFREGVAPESTPQRLCPRLPVLRENDGLPFTESMAMLARAMQWGSQKGTVCPHSRKLASTLF